jgi:hypothetical protein
MNPISKFFKKLRFDKDHHLGAGDIRLTLGQQEEIEAMYRDAREMPGGAFCPVDTYCKETPICAWPCKKLK